MFTLKIHWNHWEREGDGPTYSTDELDLFVAADQVSAHGVIPAGEADERMAAWGPDQWRNHLDVTRTINKSTTTQTYSAGRLIQVVSGGEMTWYVASHAWLLGPDGRTIERLA